MIMDALLMFDSAALLTGIAAGAAGASTNTIDLSSSRDLAPAEVPISVVFTSLPTSATAGATLNVAVQTCDDNATWVTLEETGPQLLTSWAVGVNQWAFRGWLNAGVKRYLRLAYTPSAVLTTGAVTAQLAGDWPRNKSYPRNYVA